MKLQAILALPILAELVPQVYGFVILSEDVNQAVFQKTSNEVVDQYPNEPTRGSIDDIFHHAADHSSSSSSSSSPFSEDTEAEYADAWISSQEEEPLPSYDSSNRASGSSWWKVLRKAVGRSHCSKDTSDDHAKDEDHPHHPPPHDGPHHPPPHDGPHHPPPPHHGPPHHGKPHHPHDFTDGTIYQNLERSNYTKKIFALISNDTGLVKILNSTSNNYTFFAPTDRAFEHIPKHGQHPSPEFIKNLLYYHVSEGFYPASKVLLSHTIPSLLKEGQLGSKNELQRLRVGVGLSGLTINFYSKVIAVNVFSSNGVIHGIDHILLPPPPAIKVLELLPGTFSTFVNGLYKTGVIKSLSSNSSTGLTLFAPTNREFERLGTRALAFLFSKFGEKYLAALLKYHIVPGQTLYSDAWIKPDDDDEKSIDGHQGIPKGRFHVDLATLLDGKSLSIDIARWGRFISYKINAFASVILQDGIVKDGVIQVPNRVLLPPKASPPLAEIEKGGPISVEELKERLEPFL